MLYSFGSNGSGQLGLGHRDDVDRPSPVQLPEGFRLNEDVPRRISAGGNHTLLLTKRGHLYAAGENSDGRCAFDDSNKLSSSSFLAAGADLNVTERTFKLCSATWEASILVSSSDEVYTCGTGNRGELGQGPDITVSKELRRIPDFPPEGIQVVDIASCLSHTIAILSNGDAYGWGAGRKGQLGEPSPACWLPRKIEGLSFHAHRVACGKECSVIIGEPIEGRMSVLGSDKWLVKSDAPSSVPGWRDLGASWGGIYVLRDDGSLLCWGRNDHKQLPGKPLSYVTAMAVGSEHAVSQISNDIVVWGWGEHGNCGSVAERMDVSLEESTPLSFKGRVSMLGAGCATSWVYVDEEQASV